MPLPSSSLSLSLPIFCSFFSFSCGRAAASRGGDGCVAGRMMTFPFAVPAERLRMSCCVPGVGARRGRRRITRRRRRGGGGKGNRINHDYTIPPLKRDAEMLKDGRAVTGSAERIWAVDEKETSRNRTATATCAQQCK